MFACFFGNVIAWGYSTVVCLRFINREKERRDSNFFPSTKRGRGGWRMKTKYFLLIKCLKFPEQCYFKERHGRALDNFFFNF